MKAWSDFLFYAVLALLTLPAFIVVFAAARALLHRFWPGQRHPKWMAAFVSIVATPLLCLAGARLALALYLYYPHREFRKEQWTSDTNKRYEMVEDLEKNHRLVGLTKNQAAALLGKPDYQDVKHYGYYLGIAPGIGFTDGKTLTLELSNGKVVRYWIREN